MLIRIRPSKCCKKVRSAKEQVELAEQTQDEHHKSELERSRVKAIYGAKGNVQYYPDYSEDHKHKGSSSMFPKGAIGTPEAQDDIIGRKRVDC